MNTHVESFAVFFDTSKSMKSGPSICPSNIVEPIRLDGSAPIQGMGSSHELKPNRLLEQSEPLSYQLSM
jgi:hypothetical protein